MNITPQTPPAAAIAADSLMDSRAVAAFLGVAVPTLADWRTRGRGPAYVKVGKCVRYRLRDLQAWLESQRKGA